MLALIALAWAEPVVVAARTLPIGTQIEAADVYRAEFPAQLIPDEAVRDSSVLIGRIVRERIERDELIRTERLAPDEAGEGIAALVPYGMRAVMVAWTTPHPHVVPDSYVDVARADRGCVVVQAAFVLATEPGLQLAVTPDQVAGFADLPPGAARIWVRNPTDMRKPSLPSCTTPPAPQVVQREKAVIVQPPSGKAQARKLVQGENAYLGELWLDPGGKVPVHRDPTEEYLLVLAGSGTLTIDGTEHAVGPGTTVYMPANAEVAYTNGTERLHVIQVFAGPGPAKKYQSWTPVP